MDTLSQARICRDNYGWEACIDRAPCRTKEEVTRFYERTGILMFLFYLLGTNDIHGENIIASGEYPVAIDLENLLGMPDHIAGSNISASSSKRLSFSSECGLYIIVYPLSR